MKQLLSENEVRAFLDQDKGHYLEFKSLWDGPPGAKKLLSRRKLQSWGKTFSRKMKCSRIALNAPYMLLKKRNILFFKICSAQ